MSEQFWKLNKHDNSETSEKHVPQIELIDKGSGVIDVLVTLKHPNENGHHIQWIELRANDLFLGRVELSPVVLNPKAVFSLNASKGQ